MAHVQRTIDEHKRRARAAQTIDGIATVISNGEEEGSEEQAWRIEDMMNSEDASMPFRYLEGVLTELLNAVERKGTLALVTWNLVMHSKDLDVVHVKLQRMRDRVRSELRKSEKKKARPQKPKQS